MAIDHVEIVLLGRIYYQNVPHYQATILKRAFLLKILAWLIKRDRILVYSIQQFSLLVITLSECRLDRHLKYDQRNDPL